MKGRRFAAVVLAGGLSTRMKQFKPLLPLGNTTVLEHVLSIFKNTNIDVFLVVGYRREEIESSIKNKKVTVVYNPDYEKGMFSSIQAGIRQLRPEHHAFFILPVDILLVKPETIEQIAEAGNDHPALIIYPTFNGKRGHPPLIPSALIPEILMWEEEGGLRSFLEKHEKTACDIPVRDENILFDIDTPEDYQQLLKRYQH